MSISPPPRRYFPEGVGLPTSQVRKSKGQQLFCHREEWHPHLPWGGVRGK